MRRIVSAILLSILILNVLGLAFSVKQDHLSSIAAQQDDSNTSSMDTLANGLTGLNQADSVWVEPSTVLVPGVVGYRFNVTVWANISRSSYTWQFSLTFDSNYFAATGVGYTAGGTSEFFSGHSTLAVVPTITSSSVTFAESLSGGDSRAAGWGSLGWVEFEVKAVSWQSQVLSITNADTYVLDSDLNQVPVACSDASVVSGPGVDLCSVVRGMDDRIYYRVWNGTDLEDWMTLPGSTIDNPAAALLGNELHVVVRGSDGYSLWHGYVNLTDNTFNGWTMLDGYTPSAPTLTSNGTALCLAVRGGDNRIYCRTYSLDPRGWGDWNVVPTGATLDAPAAAIFGNDLHLVVRGMDGNSLWDTIVSCDGAVVRNWSLLSGTTPSRPVLSCSGADNLCLAVRGMGNTIYYRSYTNSADSWGGWNAVPTGATIDGPGATVMGSELYIVVRGSDGFTLWCGNLDLGTNSFSGWTLLDGATPSAPTLAAHAQLIEHVELVPVDPGLTSPAGTYRWLDVADQAYGIGYRNSYNYSQADVEVAYCTDGDKLRGFLNGGNLKPNFAYQLKLVGTPGTVDNERIGFAGRWWQEEWTGTTWANGQNLNDKGDGSSPNPNDQAYLSRRYVQDGSSPTGYHYRYTGYLVFDYFTTDSNGTASLEFETGSCYHVVWKTTQRNNATNDGPVKTVTFDPTPSQPAYDTDYPSNTVSIFGEWERLPTGQVNLQPGEYNCQILLTEESFHGSCGTLAGNWAGAVTANIRFTITKTYTPNARAHLQAKPSFFLCLNRARGKNYDPLNMSQEFGVDGLRVRFTANRTGKVSVHMWGHVVKLASIEKLR